MTTEREQTRRQLYALVDRFVDNLIAGELPCIESAEIKPCADMAFGGSAMSVTVPYSRRRSLTRLPRVRTMEGCFALAGDNAGQVEALIKFFGPSIGEEKAIELATSGKEFLTDLSINDISRRTNLLFKIEEDAT
jgi:hypothetical protein